MLNLLVLLLGVFITLLSLGLGVVLPITRTAAAPRYRPGEPPPAVPKRHVAQGMLGGIIGIALIVVGFASPFVEVPAGSVGVVMNFGQVQPGTLQPGLHVVMPVVVAPGARDRRMVNRRATASL